MKKEIIDLIFPDIDKGINYYEEKYPKRNLASDAVVTRYAPSPTGFVHIGNLLATYIEKKSANQSNGVFFLRIEDTDQKREIEDGTKLILEGLKEYDIEFDEGPLADGSIKGNYGPYIQSHRGEIYRTFARYLMEIGSAYSCFCSEEDIDATRKKQEAIKDRIGYYGHYAKCRNLTDEEILEKINIGIKPIVRLKSPGSFLNKKIFHDEVKGDVTMPENDMDIVIIKSDGLPTYHFAHLVDDYLMRTTHVIRADEWFPSLPIHVQLFEVFGFEPPKYVHISPLMKNDNGSVRKLSKRKDPEVAASYYQERGFPHMALKLYVATVANTNFEEWLNQNPDKPMDDFRLSFDKISSSGSLFDLEKIVNISRNYISRLKASEVYGNVYEWAKKYDNEMYDLLEEYKDYSIAIFNIEREQAKPRKDFATYADIKTQIWYMYDELFNDAEKNYEFQKEFSKEDITSVLKTYIEKYYNENDDKDTWFSNIKAMCSELGFASEMKEYKANPDNYKGSVADITMIIRVVLTTRAMTPDLYEIIKLLGKDRVLKRFETFM